MANNSFWLMMNRIVTLFLGIKERLAVGKVFLVVVLAVMLMAGYITLDLSAQGPENGVEPNNPPPEPR